MTLIGQKNIDITKQPSSENGMMYGCSVGASCHEAHGMLSPAVEGKVDFPLKTKICVEGKSFYFEGFHTTSQEACELLCAKLGI